MADASRTAGEELLRDPEPNSQQPEEPIVIAGPPWTLTGDIYMLCFWISAAQAAAFPTSLAYSPLEAASPFADPSTSRPVGGIGIIHIIRYRESPVGPYDELAITPGKFAWTRDGGDDGGGAGDGGGGGGGDGRTRQWDYKISRIYVSQKHTCYNGRANWNIPKHLARFEWEDRADGSITVKVYPHDTTTEDGNETESRPSATPFFQATMKSVPCVPSFPFSTTWLKHLGGTRAVFPPLPRGKGGQGELPGTEKWCMVTPRIWCRRSALVSVDMAQRGGDGKGDGQEGDGKGKEGSEPSYENFWPGLRRWHVGVKMANAEMFVGEPEETW